MRRTGYFVDGIQLVITDKFMKEVVEKCPCITQKTFESYEEFCNHEWVDFGRGSKIKADLIDYMFKDDLVYWDYVNYNEKNYAVLKKTDSF